jgi:hypothetical protein
MLHDVFFKQKHYVLIHNEVNIDFFQANYKPNPIIKHLPPAKGSPDGSEKS